MAFLISGPESGHTERHAHAETQAVATVLFHPDFNRRLRNRTESADPSSLLKKKALAGLGFLTLTAGGDFHPALRTSAARYERPWGNYAQRAVRQQAAMSSESRMTTMTAARTHRIGAGKTLTIGATKIND
jgi:hypothetical protein